MVSTDAECAFDSTVEKIRLPFTEVLLRATIGDLARSKKLRDWASLNAVLLPIFLIEAVVLDSYTSTTELLKILSANIAGRGLYAATKTSESKDEDKYES